jgi:heterodisulfide reductase subunit B
LKAVALSARNLALAEAQNPGEAPVDVVSSCAGCYRALMHAERSMQEGGEEADRVGGALEAIGLRYGGRTRVRHPLDVLLNDVGVERIAAKVIRPLEGLKIASYYGCLLVRPYAAFDDVYNPVSMDRLLAAAGAETIDWPLKTRCCGGSCYCGGPMIGAMPEATLKLSYTLVREAKRRGANAIATVCPLCEFNLEGFQDRMERDFGDRLDMPVGFATQFLGLALGLDERSLGIHRMLRWLPGTPAPELGQSHAGA